MQHWIKVTGTGENPFDTDDWRPRRDAWRSSLRTALIAEAARELDG